jgi:hypothetical protein
VKRKRAIAKRASKAANPWLYLRVARIAHRSERHFFTVLIFSTLLDDSVWRQRFGLAIFVTLPGPPPA